MSQNEQDQAMPEYQGEVSFVRKGLKCYSLFNAVIKSQSDAEVSQLAQQ